MVGDVAIEWGQARSQFRHLSGRVIHLKQGAALLLAGYARGGDIAAVLAEVAQATGQGVVPFILAADCNISHDDLSARAELAALGARALPSPGPVTCFQGAGSCVDHLVASDCLCAYVEDYRLITEVPFGPHAAFSFVIRRNPRAVMITRFW